jgi:hypothetical protein
MERGLVEADTPIMIDQSEGPANNVLFHPSRGKGSPTFSRPALVVAGAVSTTVSIISYAVLTMLVGIGSMMSAFISGMSGSTPPPEPKAPYGPLGLALILSPWLVFATVVATRFIWWVWKTKNERHRHLSSERRPA